MLKSGKVRVQMHDLSCFYVFLVKKRGKETHIMKIKREVKTLRKIR